MAAVGQYNPPRIRRTYTGEHGEQLVELSKREYDEFLEEFEELQDIAIINERCNEPTIPWEEIKERLKKDGYL
jgi:hypothetical protein